MEIIDAHVHFWDPRSTPRAVTPLVRLLGFQPRLLEWVARRVFPRAALAFYHTPRHVLRPYLPAELDEDRGRHPVRGVVHVEAGWEGRGPLAAVDETRWLEALDSGEGPRIEAIVGRADLSRGAAVADVLRGHLAASPRLRGVRDVLSWHPSGTVLDGAADAERTRDPAWRAGFEALAEHGLHFEATVYDTQLEELAELAEAYPGQPIVVSHLGTPVGGAGPFGEVGRTAAERAEIVARWTDGLTRLAACPNVWIKLSGLGMPVVGLGYERRPTRPGPEEVAHDMAPFLDAALERFGAERCLFGSNFPVDKVGLSYAGLVEAYRLALADRPAAELEAIFGGNARRFYRVGSDA